MGSLIFLFNANYKGGNKMSRTRNNHYNMQKYKLEVDRERTRLLALPDTDLLNQILSHPNPNRLNTVVPYDSFPAYDIALKIKENGWTPTPKQRKALVNVYSHDMVFVQRPLELENKRPKPIKGLSNPVALSAMRKSREFQTIID